MVRKLIKNSLFFGVLRGFGAILGFASSLIVVRMLGDDQAGYFYFYLTLITFLSVALSFGIPDFIVNKVSYYYSESNLRKTNAVLYSCLAIILFGSGLFFVIKETFFFVSDFSRDEGLALVVDKYVISVFFLMALILFSSLFQAAKKLFFAIFYQNIFLPMLFCLLAFLTSPGSCSIFIELYIISMLITFIFSGLTWYFGVGFSFKPDFRGLDIAKTLSFYLSRLFASLSANVSVLLVSYFGSVSEVAYVSVSTRLISVLSLVLVTTNMMFAPNMSILHNKNDIIGLEAYISKAYWLVFGLVFPMMMIMLIGSDFILGFFGPEFVNAKPYLLTMLAFQFVSLLCGPVNSVMNMCGLEKVYKNIVMSTSFLSLLFLMVCYVYEGELSTFLIVFSNYAGIAAGSILALLFIKRKMGFYIFGKPNILRDN